MHGIQTAEGVSRWITWKPDSSTAPEKLKAADIQDCKLCKYRPDFLKYGFACTTKTNINYPQCSEVLAWERETSKALVSLLRFCFQQHGQRCIHLNGGGREGHIWWGWRVANINKCYLGCRDSKKFRTTGISSWDPAFHFCPAVLPTILKGACICSVPHL